jgi:hypothetical protein
MDLLPKMCSENLNKRNLQSGYFSMHENTSQIQLDLKPNVNIRPVNSRTPPKSKSSIWDLIQPRSLRMCQFLEFHGFFEPGSFLPKESFPSREISPFEQSVLKNAFHSSKSLYYISSVIIQVPEFSVVTLMSPYNQIKYYTKRGCVLSDGRI